MSIGDEREKTGRTDYGVTVRVATPRDAEQLLAIYAPYVKRTAISFEYEVPSQEEFRERIVRTLENYPYLAAVQGDEILGYCYTGAFVGRKAYQWSAETSIYLKKDATKKGIGRKLYEAVERVSAAQNILNLNACIGYTENEDEYLNRNSAQFHSHMGYRLVGTFHNSGYKFGRWYDMIWMEKLIGKHSAYPREVIPFREFTEEMLKKAGVVVADDKITCS